MTLQYLEALKQLGATAATKYVIPLELTDLARRLGNFLDNGLETGRDVRMAIDHGEPRAPVAASGPAAGPSGPTARSASTDTSEGLPPPDKTAPAA